MTHKTKIFSNLDSIVGTDTVLCYGHFNVIHPGHLRYLEYAKSLSKNLCIALRADKDLDLDEEFKHFSEKERSAALANLNLVDSIVITSNYSFAEIISIIKPNFVVLGGEFEDSNDIRITSAFRAANECGSKIIFHAGETHYASSNFLYDEVSSIEQKNFSKLRKICSSNNISERDLTQIINNFSKANILVIGDTIVDNYVACDPVGLSAEAPVMVIKEIESKQFIGGASIVASHVSSLGANCHFMSVLGNDENKFFVEEQLKKYKVKCSFFIDESRPTTFKTRYLVNNQKILRVSKIKEHNISREIENDFLKKFEDVIDGFNGVLLSDFSYGVITTRVLNSIEKICQAKNIKLFGDIQCSSQIGNISKFKNFDLLTPTEKEARITLSDNNSGIELIAHKLMDETKCSNLILKLGADGFIAYENKKNGLREHIPALNSNPIDVAGAGDSLISIMSVCSSVNKPFIHSLILGACMASLAVGNIGNIPITSDKLKKYISKIFK